MHSLAIKMHSQGVKMKDCTTANAAGTLAAIRQSKAAAITRAEAAAALGIDPRTVSVAINDGTIPSIRLGRRVLIPREKFLALFETA